MTLSLSKLYTSDFPAVYVGSVCDYGDVIYTHAAAALNVVPFLGAVRDEGLKNFFTVVTFRVFSLVFFSSNLEKGPREACGPGCGCGAVD